VKILIVLLKTYSEYDALHNQTWDYPGPKQEAFKVAVLESANKIAERQTVGKDTEWKNNLDQLVAGLKDRAYVDAGNSTIWTTFKNVNFKKILDILLGNPDWNKMSLDEQVELAATYWNTCHRKVKGDQ